MNNDLSMDIDYLAVRLTPLIKEGKSIALQLHSPHAAGKRKNPLLLLTPGTSFGWPSERIAIAVVNLGSVVIELESKREYNRNRKLGIVYQPRIADCVRAGIPAKLATILVTTLQKLYLQPKEKKHGNTSKRTTSARRTSTRPHRYTPYREC